MAARSAATRWGVLRALGLAVRAATRPGAPTVPERLAAVPRMVRAAMSGQFRGLTKGRLLAMLGALVYIVSPIDLVPEGIFSVFGIADDAMLVGWLAAALVNHTEDYLAWERGVGATGPQDAPRSAGPADRTVPSYVVR
jgi:uncharacterized membrane protein YkvA (DUF1232 family)